MCKLKEFNEINLHLYFKLISIMLAYCFVSFILKNPYHLFHVSSDHNSLTVHTYDLL